MKAMKQIQSQMIVQKASTNLNPLIVELNDANINPKADDKGEWVLNKNSIFDYVLSSSNVRFDGEDV